MEGKTHIWKYNSTLDLPYDGSELRPRSDIGFYFACANGAHSWELRECQFGVGFKGSAAIRVAWTSID